jgi:hypothetical protein
MKTTNLLKFRLTKKTDEELSDTICHECQFCGKLVHLDNTSHKMCERFSGDAFFCPFCIRHGFFAKSNRDVLMLSFRGIIGYYYCAYYCYDNKIYLSQIRDLIENHSFTGLKNPVFSYDPETFMWFVDFSKVGQGKKKISLENILITIDSILDSLDIDVHLSDAEIIRNRFMNAVERFYTHRYRPKNQKQLIPSVKGTTNKLDEVDLNWTKRFTLKNLLIRI